YNLIKIHDVSFFQPIVFASNPKSYPEFFLEKVDSYFYLGGKKAYVIENTDQGKKAVLCKDRSPCLITALKVASYATIILPVILLIIKAVLRSIHTFELIDVQQRLEEGIDISAELQEELQELFPIIQQGERGAPDARIHWHASGNNLVFSLRSHPDLIFKTNRQGGGAVLRRGGFLPFAEMIPERFANMITAYTTCLAYRLDRLVVPHAKKFSINAHPFIAEKRLNISQEESDQERLHREFPDLHRAQQLATLIAKTGFSDVEWRNIPLIEEDPALPGIRKVALVDLEEMDSAATGIFGGRRRGLIGCLHSEEEIDLVIEEAQRHGVYRFGSSSEIKNQRMEQIREDLALDQFYEERGILENPVKSIPIVVLDTLGLNLDEEETIQVPHVIRNGTDAEPEIGYQEEVVTLRDAATHIIE
ncbi:MAG: DUF648 domain-containing protein, partial [Chlamydiales bacterium]|nr:DUF648 domain-containing protein [Chlamydiales bacterium]